MAHADHLASIQVRTDSAGAVLERQAYMPFGDPASGNLTSPVSFIGERRDLTGLMYLNARYYASSLGRFVSPDPTVPAQSILGLNRYAYAYNNPIGLNDRNGLDPDDRKGGNAASPPLATALAVLNAFIGSANLHYSNSYSQYLNSLYDNGKQPTSLEGDIGGAMVDVSVDGADTISVPVMTHADVDSHHSRSTSTVRTLTRSRSCSKPTR